MGITHIVLHLQADQERLERHWERRFEGWRMEKVYEEEGIAIYRLIDPDVETASE